MTQQNPQGQQVSEAQPLPVPAGHHVSMTTAELGEVLAANSRSVKQSRDKAQYVRQQKGHSFILHWFVLGIFSMFIVPIYYSVSPNHYWHA